MALRSNSGMGFLHTNDLLLSSKMVNFNLDYRVVIKTVDFGKTVEVDSVQIKIKMKKNKKKKSLKSRTTRLRVLG